MFWLMAIIVLILILCIPLDDEERAITKHVDRLADESRKRDAIHKPLHRPWLG